MSSELLRKLKAALLIITLVGAEIRQVEQDRNKHAFRGSATSASSVGASGANSATRSSNRVQYSVEEVASPVDRLQLKVSKTPLEAAFGSSVADPQEIAKDFVEMLKEMLSNPDFLQQPKLVAKRMDLMMADPHLQEDAKRVAEAMLASRNFRHQAKLIASQFDALMADADMQKKLEIFTEEMQALMNSPTDWGQGSMDMLISNIVSKEFPTSFSSVLEASFLPRANEDQTTLGKPIRFTTYPSTHSGPYVRSPTHRLLVNPPHYNMDPQICQGSGLTLHMRGMSSDARNAAKRTRVVTCALANEIMQSAEGFNSLSTLFQTVYGGALIAAVSAVIYLFAQKAISRRDQAERLKVLGEKILTTNATATEYFQHGSILIQTKAYNQAIRSLEKSATLCKGDIFQLAQVYNALGYAYAGSSRFNQAVDAYREAVRLQPAYTIAWNNLGDVYEQSGNYKKALECFEETLLYDKENSVALRQKGVVSKKMMT